MAGRENARRDAAFARGELGADGAAVEEQKDAAQLERDKAREQLLRGKAFLGREFLTWLLWRTESGDPLLAVADAPVTVLFSDRLVLKGLAGEVVEASLRGKMAPYSPLVRRSLARGLLVHQARLAIMHGEFPYAVTVDAEQLAFKGAKLPETTKPADEARVQERADLAARLAAIVQALCEAFLRVRAAKRWPQEVAAMRAWMLEERS